MQDFTKPNPSDFSNSSHFQARKEKDYQKKDLLMQQISRLLEQTRKKEATIAVLIKNNTVDKLPPTEASLLLVHTEALLDLNKQIDALEEQVNEILDKYEPLDENHEDISAVPVAQKKPALGTLISVLLIPLLIAMLLVPVLLFFIFAATF